LRRNRNERPDPVRRIGAKRKGLIPKARIGGYREFLNKRVCGARKSADAGSFACNWGGGCRPHSEEDAVSGLRTAEGRVVKVAPRRWEKGEAGRPFRGSGKKNLQGRSFCSAR